MNTTKRVSMTKMSIKKIKKENDFKKNPFF